jgi:hypothetical protein
MGLFFRRSIKLGPIRLNFSSSGVGASVGVRGLRVGVNSRGQQYVRAGLGGVYFHQVITPRSSGPAVRVEPQVQFTEQNISSHVSALDRASDSELVALLNETSKWVRWHFITTGATIVSSLALLPISARLAAFTCLLGIAITCRVARWESCRRAILLSFGLSGRARQVFVELVEGFNRIAECSQVWWIPRVAALADWHESKQNAGATGLVDRQSAKVGAGVPPGVDSDTPIPTLFIAGQSLYFLPDGLLVYQDRIAAHVPYDDLQCTSIHERFIEETAPRDAQVVGYTWLHPNRDGTPDRRFSNNYQLPICLEGKLRLSSHSGVNIVLQTSVPTATDKLASTLLTVGQALVAARNSRRGDASQLFRPIVVVNPERFESLWDTTKRDISLLRHRIGEFALVFDDILRRVCGEGNHILHNFLRIFSIATALGAIASTTYVVLRMAFGGA